jgi:hypothetical protein
MVRYFLPQSADDQEIRHVEKSVLLWSLVDHHFLKYIVVNEEGSPRIVFAFGPVFDDHEMVWNLTACSHLLMLLRDLVRFGVDHVDDFDQLFLKVVLLNFSLGDGSDLEDGHQTLFLQVRSLVVLNFIQTDGGIHAQTVLYLMSEPSEPFISEALIGDGMSLLVSSIHAIFTPVSPL